MQTDISVYSEEGRIVRTVSCPQGLVAIQEIPEGGGYVGGEWDDRYFHVVPSLEGPVATPRPAMPCALDKARIAADGAETATLSGLPDPCTVVYEGPGFRQEGEVTGGVAEFDTDAPGKHTVKVSAWPYLDWEGSFDAL